MSPLMVPFSVRQRRRGLVRDPAVHGYSLLDPQWVPAGTTVADRKRASMIKKADRVIAVLARFVARVSRSFRFRKIFSNGNIAWSTLMEREDLQNAEERAVRIRNLIVMPESQVNAYFRAETAAVRDIGDLWVFMKYIYSARDQREELINRNRAVWAELNFNEIGLSCRTNSPVNHCFRVGAVTIGRPSVPVPVQAPVRRTGHFSALEDDE